MIADLRLMTVQDRSAGERKIPANGGLPAHKYMPSMTVKPGHGVRTGFNLPCSLLPYTNYLNSSSLPQFIELQQFWHYNATPPKFCLCQRRTFFVLFLFICLCGQGTMVPLPLNPCTLAERLTTILLSFLNREIVINMKGKKHILPRLRPCNAP